MEMNRASFWKKYIGNTRLDLSIAEYTKVSSSWSGKNFKPHFNKFYYFLDGEGFICINGQRYHPKPGQLFLLPAGATQSFGTVKEHTYEKYWCHFTAKIGELHLLQVIEAPIFITVDDQQAVEHKFKNLVQYSKSEELYSEFLSQAILLELLSMFMKENQQQPEIQLVSAPSISKINKVLKFIDEHLAENLSVDYLSGMLNFHPNYFIKVFKNCTGYSPIQYINHQRFEKAEQMLVMSDLTVSQIADKIGMELTYFSRKFKEKTGFSPRAYREMIIKSTKEQTENNHVL
ncbi:helix-turn-helix domain-containing protein [Halalkalibacter urbisdiaboli]|uniref:helix-turn-helix domain-containing protein n=1 Tax=Halalkalibacter urbisdiaboli TaxID=1960589 RepID=UPI0013FD603E|nr:AraC family transcriptional regulator [Halalkalibacter urbisdiaboli]